MPDRTDVIQTVVGGVLLIGLSGIAYGVLYSLGRFSHRAGWVGTGVLMWPPAVEYPFIGLVTIFQGAVGIAATLVGAVVAVVVARGVGQRVLARLPFGGGSGDA